MQAFFKVLAKGSQTEMKRNEIHTGGQSGMILLKAKHMCRSLLLYGQAIRNN